MVTNFTGTMSVSTEWESVRTHAMFDDFANTADTDDRDPTLACCAAGVGDRASGETGGEGDGGGGAGA
jgi:hypothetical protein